MNLPFHIAWRYFYSKKSQNAINWISRISQAGITIGTMALIVVLSVFNGFEGVILTLYNSFDPDIKIQPHSGKYFEIDTMTINKLKAVEGVMRLSPVIEENALVRLNDKQTIVTMKGMNQHYLMSIGLSRMVVAGEPVLKSQGIDFTILGSGIAGKLGMSLFDQSSALQVYFPNRKNPSIFSASPVGLFQTYKIFPSGIFQVQQDFDEKYMIVSLDFIQKLVKRYHQFTAYEIIYNQDADEKTVENNLEKIISKKYKVQNRHEQHKWLYNIMKSEKLIVFLILSFILLVAGFNLIGSLLMLSIEKKKDMMILRSMGTEASTIRKIFFYEGLMLSMFSAAAGLILGTIICLLQMHFEIIKLAQGTTFIIDAYPVALKFTDFIYVFIVVLLLGFISSFLPANSAFKNLRISEINK